MAAQTGTAPRTAYGFGVAGLGVLIVWLVWKVPKWQASTWSPTLTPAERAELEDKSRGTLVSLVSGLGLVAVAALTLSQVIDARVSANRTADLTRFGQLDQRFSSAITDIGATNATGEPVIELRLGGIYLLRQFAFTAGADGANTVTNILTAYLRENAPAKPEPAPAVTESVTASCTAGQAPVRSDVQAALDVLQELYPTPIDEPPFAEDVATRAPRLDLSRTDLSGANLSYLNLSLARLVGTRLYGARLNHAALQAATLSGVDARYACFYKTELDVAFIDDHADLSHADLSGSSMYGTCFGKTTTLTAAKLDDLVGSADETPPCAPPAVLK